MLRTAVAITALLVTPSTLPAASPAPAKSSANERTAVRAQQAEADDRFTFRAEPISPRVVEDLLSWLSDGPSGPVAAVELDLAFHSNRYSGDLVADPEGWFRVDTPDTATGVVNWIAYKRLGRLANGVHVLSTRQGGGGTGVFASLLLVTFDIGDAYGEDGAKHPRLVMTRHVEIPVGDRFDGPIAVTAHEIRIGPGRIAGDREDEPVRVLRFD